MTLSSVPIFSKLMFTFGSLTSLVIIIMSRISNVKAANDNDSIDSIDTGIRENNYQTSALKEHNSFRYLHRAPPLVLDYKLNILARKCARYYARIENIDSSCPHKNDTTESFLLGENLALDHPTNFERDKSYRKNADIAVDAVAHWYNELTKYKFLKPGYTRSAEHFTQVVWRKCTRLGFGIYRDQTASRVYIVALYDPPGNTLGEFEDNVKRRQLF